MKRSALLVLALLVAAPPIGCEAQQRPDEQEPPAAPDQSAERSTAGERSAPQAEPPNLLFIVTDDQRFDMLGAVHPFLETPNMDRLAAEGVRFENAFVTTPKVGS